MYEFTVEKGRISINLKALIVGNDLCVIVSGGDSPHIGAVTLSVPRPSIADPNEKSASTSVLTLTGHKDDEIARHVSQLTASKLGKNVSVICGIHVDNITNEEIKEVIDCVRESVDKLIKDCFS